MEYRRGFWDFSGDFSFFDDKEICLMKLYVI